MYSLILLILQPYIRFTVPYLGTKVQHLYTVHVHRTRYSKSHIIARAARYHTPPRLGTLFPLLSPSSLLLLPSLGSFFLSFFLSGSPISFATFAWLQFAATEVYRKIIRSASSSAAMEAERGSTRTSQGISQRTCLLCNGLSFRPRSADLPGRTSGLHRRMAWAR